LKVKPLPHWDARNIPLGTRAFLLGGFMADQIQKFDFGKHTNEKTLSIKELAEVLKVSRDTIERKIKFLFPGKMENGKQTDLSEWEITRIKEEINKNYSLRSAAEVPSDYRRMCRSCHWKHDKKYLNFKGENDVREN
jgi:transcriptional antiterminator